MKRVLLVGATGLVGQSVLHQALADQRIAQIVALSRRPLSAHPRLENPLVNFDALPGDASWWQVDAVVCTLGTTMRRAGSRQAFRRVDFEYPLAVGNLARRRGAHAFALTSSLGASARSRSFYLRTKAETENALANLGFPSLTIVRPAVIGGARAERRPGEALAAGMLRALGRLLPRRYRVVPAERIAKALLEAALVAPDGLHVVESEAL